MAEPAELLLIKDQYQLAFHALRRGLEAEEAGNRAEALEWYTRGRQHLTQGVEVPTSGERHTGPTWDTARQLQQKMRDTHKTVDAHLAELETSQVTSENQRGRLLENLPPQSSIQHLYPTVPPSVCDAGQNKTPVAKTPPPRPPSPAVPRRAPGPAPAAAAAVAMANPGEQPPAYTPQPTVGHRSLAYGFGPDSRQTGPAAGDQSQLLFIPSGVQMFFVAPDRQVSSLSSPGYLQIITIDCRQKDAAAERPSAFLHVCDWLYPLTPDIPVLLSNSGIYMFPDSLAETPGSFVGIVLSSELPAADQETFKDLLNQLTNFRLQGPEGVESEVINLSEKIPFCPPKKQAVLTVPAGQVKPLPGWSEKVAQGILSGATKLGEGLVKGAEVTERAIHKGGAKIRDRLVPEETPSDVSPHVTRSLNVAKQATGGAVRVSQFLVNGVATVAGHVAEKMAPHVKKHGAKLVPESLKKGKDGQASNLDGAKFVAASSLHGFSTVWSSLETGAKLIGKSVTSETVTTVKFKYGDDAGQATDTAIKSVVNVGVTAYNIDNLGVKAILKTTGKQTAKAMVKGKDRETAGTEGKKDDSEGESNVKEEQKPAEEKEK